MKIVVFNDKKLLDIQHEIMYFSREDNPHDVIAKITEFKPDLIIEEEKNDGVSKFQYIYNCFPNIPKAWWMIDAHTNLIDHLVYAKRFDFVFCAQSWFIPLTKRELRNKVFYLPLSHTQTETEYKEMLKTDINKDIELSFIGNIRSIHVERRKYVLELLSAYPDKFIALKTDYDRMLNYLMRSKTTFNCSLNNDLNFRVWESLACGAVPVTDQVDDAYSIQGLRGLLVLYQKLNFNTKYFLIPETNKRLQDQMLDFMRSHTITHRYNELIDMIKTEKQVDYI